MPKFRIVVETGYANADWEEEAEFSPEEWERLTKEQREERLRECCQAAIANNINTYWQEIEEERE